MTPEIPPELAEDPILLAMVKDALAMQDRFAAEPVYAKTGMGYLKPSGVEELRKIKEHVNHSRSEEDEAGS